MEAVFEPNREETKSGATGEREQPHVNRERAHETVVQGGAQALVGRRWVPLHRIN